MRFSSIGPIDRTLSGAITPGQSGPGSDANEGVLCIPETLPSDCLVSYLEYSFGGGGGVTPLQICSKCILQAQLIGQDSFSCLFC